MNKIILISTIEKANDEDRAGASADINAGGRVENRLGGRDDVKTDSRGDNVAEPRTEGKPERIIRMAVVAGGELLDYAVSDMGAVSSVGNIYKGFVTNVFPGTQSCFVNIGMEKNAVLYAADMVSVTGENNKRPVETMVRTGQKLIVQVLRDASGDKGAHVTTRLALPGKYAVLLPGSAICAVSRRIFDQRESARLREIAKNHMPAGGGLIMRTEAAGVGEERIAADVAALSERLQNMRRKEMSDRIPECIHAETDFYREMLFRMLEDDITRVITDDKASYRELLNRSSAYNPEISYKISHYREPWPLFAFHGVQNDIDNLRARKVWLKCGAFIVIDRTEAMTVIDVNTGKYNGANQRETFLRVNTEAVIETARQLRLRDVGGIVVIDALRMNNQADQRAIIDALGTELAKDRQKTAVMGFTKLGLLEMTRKRAKAGIGSQPAMASAGSAGGMGMAVGAGTTMGAGKAAGAAGVAGGAGGTAGRMPSTPTVSSPGAAVGAAGRSLLSPTATVDDGDEWLDEGVDRLFNVNIDDY